MTLQRTWMRAVTVAAAVAAISLLISAFGPGPGGFGPTPALLQALMFGCWGGAATVWYFSAYGTAVLRPYSDADLDARTEFRRTVLGGAAVPAERLAEMTDLAEAYVFERTSELPGAVFLSGGVLLGLAILPLDRGEADPWRIALVAFLAVVVVVGLVVRQRRLRLVRRFLAAAR